MNLELLDPFIQDLPEIITSSLSHHNGYINLCKFNRKGNYLAAGCSDGRCMIWDMDTRSIAKTLKGHVEAVTSLSWSRNGQYLLTTGKDWNCIHWDLSDFSQKRKLRFASPILSGQIHPKNHHLIIVCPYLDRPCLVDLSDPSKAIKIHLPLPIANDDEGNSMSNQDISQYGTACCFDKTGDNVLIGTSKGIVYIVNVHTREIQHISKVTQGPAIKTLRLHKNGRDLAINANDRIVRLYILSTTTPTSTTPQIDLIHKFQDKVNRHQWSQASFSADGEYIIGGSSGKAAHNIYIWDKNDGHLVKILQGNKEAVEDLEWHPDRRMIASVGDTGVVHVWEVSHKENWTAFAPDFIELEENIEYEEREDEFDITPGKYSKHSLQVQADEDVDVLAVEAVVHHHYSDSEDEVGPFYLQVCPEEDEDDMVNGVQDEGEDMVGHGENDGNGNVNGDSHTHSHTHTNGHSNGVTHDTSMNSINSINSMTDDNSNISMM